MRQFLEWWPRSRCVSFEPLPAAWGNLSRVVDEFTSSAAAFNIGISDREGTLTLHGSRSRSTYSSFRRVNYESERIAAHRGLRAVPSSLELHDSGDSYEVDVSVVTLDGFISASGQPVREWLSGEIDVLKSDTQGWDLQVLRGALATLSRAKVVLVEWIFDDVYGRQVPLHELDKLMSETGHVLWDIAHVYKDLSNLRTLWADLIYARR